MVNNEKISNKFVLSIDGKELDFVTGIPYKISNKEIYIDDWGGSDGSCPYLSSDDYPPVNSHHSRQLWVIKGTSHPREYKILSGRTNYYLDSKGGGHNAKLYLNSTDYSPENSCHLRQIWSFNSRNDSFKEFQIHNKQNNCYLDTRGKGRSSCIYFCSQLPTLPLLKIARLQNTNLWKFTPAFDYKLNAVISKFEYNFSLDIKIQQITKTIREDSLDNLASSAKLTTDIIFQEELTNTYSFSFNESLDFISETKLNSIIPFAGIELEFDFNHSFEANKPIAIIKKETCTITETVEVPPKSCVKATDFVDFMENIEISFEATAEITAAGDRYKKDGTIIKNAKVDADAVKLFLKENNFKGKIFKSEGNSVLAKVRGSFHGSYFLKAHRKLEDIVPKVPENTVCSENLESTHI
ncbi:5771_t:CDS:1 [Diversispora eburnea]|uniref:5771_t:CDS:1 n=1 Tax=Diversispora eburnea TaxID=1213867 RepID=A0A9N8ZIK5_9GLOM|nr:5771_t:CDS:1 [Diversispora eburnea]